MGHMRLRLPQFQCAATAIGAAILTMTLSAPPLGAQTADEMDALFAELAEPEGDAWMRAQSDIERAWSRSGSASLDFLLMRGEAALDAGDALAAVGHLTALTENAPDFASGWAARAVAFFMAGQTGPAAEDLARALALEPRHWPSLTLLGSMLEDTGDTARALEAYRASLAINPHQEDAEDGVTRLTTAQAGQGA